MIRNIKVSGEIFASNGFGDVRSGTYMRDRVTVNIARVTARDNLRQIRKASINVEHPGYNLNRPSPAIP